ncbi:MAG TPA: dipeptidase [Acidimicrobiia bacterium]|nr:dipeptidase [Acidimicrobiia bacterium]
MDTTHLTAAVDEQFPAMQAVLEDLVRIPSVSAPGYPADEVRRSAVHIAELLAAEGASRVQLLELEGAHPAVFGEVPGPEGSPTVLLYAHHDVQPPGPAAEWETNPFEPFERDGRLFGRGASDDKSGVVMHLATLRAFAGRPPATLKVFIEGEEEVGSAHLADFLAAHAELLRADVIVIADAGVWRVGTPGLTTSLRGLAACVVEVRTAAHAVHSGQFGGLFPDAITALARLLATLHHEDGSVAVGGLVAYEREELDLTTDEIREIMGAPPGLRDLGTGGITSRLWTKPAISVLAVDAPPVSEAINQLVPTASAKVSMRIAPGQDAGAALDALRRHLLDHAPWGVDVTVTGVEKGSAFQLATSGPAADAWRDSMRQVWKTEPVEMGAGGSIPFVADFSSLFPDATILLTGAGDPTSAIHAPNESQDLGELRNSILAQVLAIHALG